MQPDDGSRIRSDAMKRPGFLRRFVNRTKDQIKNAPEFDENRYRDQGYLDELGSYYGPGGAGSSDPKLVESRANENTKPCALAGLRRFSA